MIRPDRVPFGLPVRFEQGKGRGKSVAQGRKMSKAREKDNKKAGKLFPMSIQMYAK